MPQQLKIISIDIYNFVSTVIKALGNYILKTITFLAPEHAADKIQNTTDRA